jgi:transketolase
MPFNQSSRREAAPDRAPECAPDCALDRRLDQTRSPVALDMQCSLELEHCRTLALEQRSALALDMQRALALDIRRAVIEMTHRARSSHLGSALSAADLLAALYGGILRIDPAAPAAPGRDRFLLSKGHACAALYAALASRGFFPASWLRDFYQDGSALAGHATHKNVPGVEVSTGSLGHGLPIACGLALAAKKDAAPYRVFALLSDGECDEGSVWEAALFAAHHALDNLVAIVDYNKIQSLGTVEEVLGLEPFAEKWRSFGWSVAEINGHDLSQIGAALEPLPREPGKPACVIAHTIKGKGVGFMENNLLWHYRAPNAAELNAALAELNAAPNPATPKPQRSTKPQVGA